MSIKWSSSFLYGWAPWIQILPDKQKLRHGTSKYYRMHKRGKNPTAFSIISEFHDVIFVCRAISEFKELLHKPNYLIILYSCSYTNTTRKEYGDVQRSGKKWGNFALLPSVNFPCQAWKHANIFLIGRWNMRMAWRLDARALNGPARRALAGSIYFSQQPDNGRVAWQSPLGRTFLLYTQINETFNLKLSNPNSKS